MISTIEWRDSSVVMLDKRLLPDQELIEFICNENQQFGRRIQLD